MRPEHLTLLRSPINGKELLCENAIMESGRIRSGILTDGKNSYQIVDFVPRFVDHHNYCASFSVEWEKHPDILYGSRSNYSLYEERFTKETRWGKKLSGQLVLEAGCGCGALTPYALQTGATVVSFDASNGVERSFRANGRNPQLLLLQADIFCPPFPDNSFDKIFCFGVLQHTPDPRLALSSLVSKLKPGGNIVCDIYSVPLEGNAYRGLLNTKYLVRRLTAGKDPVRLYKTIKRYVRIMWPLSQIIRLVPRYGVRVNRRFLIDDYPNRLPGMIPQFYKEFACLDVFDMLSPAYDYPSTPEEFRKWHDELGLLNVEVGYGYNGIEGRGTKTSQ